MRKLLSLTVVVIIVVLYAVGAATGTTTAQASKGGTTVTSTTVIITKHDRQVIRFFHNHPKLAATPQGGRVLAKLLPHVVRSLQAATAHAVEQAAKAKAKAAAAASTTTATEVSTSGYPPHHLLWECIHNHEAGSWSDHNSGGNGHYGGLQMSWNWGNGITGDAGNYSQAQQEWAAERAYAASGYSYSFLYGQWYKWDTADGCGS